jgi:Fe-S cluster assembly ATPase SufC
MAGVQDIAIPAVGSLGGLGLFIYMARLFLDDRAAGRALDRPLQKAVSELEKDRDAKNTRIVELERENSDLNDQRNAARSAASAAEDKARSLESDKAALERRLAEATSTGEEQRAEIARLRAENRRLKAGETR